MLTWVLIDGCAVADRPQAVRKHVVRPSRRVSRAAARACVVCLQLSAAIFRLLAHRIQTGRRASAEVDINVDARQSRHFGPVWWRRDFNARMANIPQDKRVQQCLGVRHRGVHDDVTDAFPAHSAAATAWHGKLAAQAAALVEVRKGPSVSAIADEVERDDVFAEPVETAEGLSALAAADAATTLASASGKGVFEWTVTSLRVAAEEYLW